MRIVCPWCGSRPLNEYSYGGDASTSRPEHPENAGLEDWMNHVYWRDNPAGPHKEYWQHVSGCRSWLAVKRDTVTHEISMVTLADPPSCGDKP